MAPLSFGIFVISALNSLEVLAQIPTSSIDYWIGNISPRCAIHIIYDELTNDFTFHSTYNIPLMLVSLKFYRTKSTEYSYYLRHHKFYHGSLRFMKAECHFSVLYYKMLYDLDESFVDYKVLYDLIGFTIYSYSSHLSFPFLSSTYCLILSHVSKWNEKDYKSDILLTQTMEMKVAIVFLSDSLKSGYNVYCKTPSMKFQVGAWNVVDKVHSIVNHKFMITCSSLYTFVFLNENDEHAAYDSKRLVYEHQIITSMFLKVNISIFASAPYIRYGEYVGGPRVIVSDFTQFKQTWLFFPTFENSIRFFTCYTIPVLSFYFYVSAFELEVWIAITLSGCLLAIFLKYHIYYNLSKTLNFSTLLFYFSIFMEESYNIPSNIQNNKVYRIATILWLLTAVVYTNSYISHVISRLNAPLTGEKLGNSNLYGNSAIDVEIDLKYFKGHYTQLYDLQMDTSSFFNGYLNSFLEVLHLSQTSTSGYTILSEPVNLPYPENVSRHLRNPFIYSSYYNNLIQLNFCYWRTIPSNSTMCRTLIKLMKLPNKFYLDSQTYKRPWKSRDFPTGAVEEELIKCQKSVYAEQSNQLEFHYMSENYKKKRFYYLQESFASTQKKWGFYNLQNSKLPFYFSMFLQSGIFHELHKLKLLRDHHKRRSMTSEIIKRTHKPEILDLSSSVQTVFILFAAMSLLAKLAFVAEFCYSACNKKNFFLLKTELLKVAEGAKYAYHTFYKIGNFKDKLFEKWKKDIDLTPCH